MSREKRRVDSSMGAYDDFRMKLEMLLGNLMKEDNLRIRIDDRGIYWGSKCRCGQEHFLEFSQLDDTPITEVMEKLPGRSAAN